MTIHAEIDAGGRKVVLDCPDVNMSAKELAQVVLDTWHATEGAVQPSDGPASYGFIAERAR